MNTTIVIKDTLDVTPQEVAATFHVELTEAAEQQAYRFFRRKWILEVGDFDKALRVGGLWRGSRAQWEAIKKKMRVN